ncbi:GTP pyrophosphokinase family protein [Streptomyces sp. NPDC051561]|uniref:GTP pyrophosphokinase family protein n=1 Tax=Streptomyces sp. NPDC051561 TaxID=3365658 RepID=UPI0037BDD8A1
MYGDDIARDRIATAYPAVYPVVTGYAAVLRSLIEQLCRGSGLKPHSVEARAKDPASLLDKFQRHPGYEWLSDAEDLCGVRIVTYFLADVELVRGLLKREFRVLKEESREAQSPDAFGYRSLHLIGCLDERRNELHEYAPYAHFWVEFQVRTVLQDAWGSISHSLDYKNEAETPPEIRRKLFRVAALLETGDEIFANYRSEVEEVRARYRSQAGTGDWSLLPLNIDSLRSSWARLPVEQVVAVAGECGFERDPRKIVADQLPDSAVAGTLLSLASLAGVDTLGELSAFIDLAPRHRAKLSLLAVTSGSHGYIPTAQPLDVILFLLLLAFPELRARSAVTFHPAIEAGLDAALELEER